MTAKFIIAEPQRDSGLCELGVSGSTQHCQCWWAGSSPAVRSNI